MYLPNWANILNHQLLHVNMFTKIYFAMQIYKIIAIYILVYLNLFGFIKEGMR